MVGDLCKCPNCLAPACNNCGAVIRNKDRHAAKCREKLQELIPGSCAASQLIRDAKGHIRNLPCGIEEDHDMHCGLFEGYAYTWGTPELIAV